MILKPPCNLGLLVLLVLLLTACDSSLMQPEEDPSAEQAPTDPAQLHASPDVNRDLATVRGATASFHNVSKAVEAEYVQITECEEHPTLGAQGIHYGKESLILDDIV